MPGVYNYTFQCQLPPGLPTSLEGEIGHVRYRVRVILDIPLWIDKKFEKGFTVIRPFDLNSNQHLRVSF